MLYLSIRQIGRRGERHAICMYTVDRETRACYTVYVYTVDGEKR